MIFVTVGTARDFSRLVKEVDEVAKNLKDEVIIQRGQTKYKPKNCKYFDFVPRDEFSELMKKADIAITHGGVGSIINSLRFGNPTIVVPRRKKYNEHKNDHQMDITKELESESIVIACYEVDRLEEKIKMARNFRRPKKSHEREGIKRVIRNFIEEGKN